MAADNPLFQPSLFIPATPFVIPAKAGIQTPVICPFNHLIGNLPLTTSPVAFQFRWYDRQQPVIPAKAGIQTPVAIQLNHLKRNAAPQALDTILVHRVSSIV